MRTLALAGALALVGGLSFAAPAHAGYYDEDGVYHPTASDFDDLMSPAEVRAELRSQGYLYIRNLDLDGDNYSAIAYIDGDWVRITVDGDSGDVIDTDDV